MKNRVLIQNGRVFDSEKDLFLDRDVLIEGDMITRVDTNIAPTNGETVIDASGEIAGNCGFSTYPVNTNQEVLFRRLQAVIGD